MKRRQREKISSRAASRLTTVEQLQPEKVKSTNPFGTPSLSTGTVAAAPLIAICY